MIRKYCSLSNLKPSKTWSVPFRSKNWREVIAFPPMCPILLHQRMAHHAAHHVWEEEMRGWGSGPAYFNRNSSGKGLWLWLPLLRARQKRLHQICNIDCLKTPSPKSKVQAKRYRTCCTTSLINDSAVRDREAVDNDPKPIVANASEFSEHWSDWGIYWYGTPPNHQLDESPERACLFCYKKSLQAGAPCCRTSRLWDQPEDFFDLANTTKPFASKYSWIRSAWVQP